MDMMHQLEAPAATVLAFRPIEVDDAPDPSLEELDYRENNGMEVTLMWDRTSGSLSVFVVDSRCGEMFELDVAPHEAMEVFNHPYAYASFRGVEPRSLDPAADLLELEAA